MNLRLAVAVVAVLATTVPTFAATYYVAHKPNATTCVVVKAKPNGKSMMMVGTAGYSSMAKASAAMKAAAACKY